MYSKSSSAIILMLGMSMLILGCNRYNGNGAQAGGEEDAMVQKIYIDSVQPEETESGSKETLKLRVSGNLPSPAYSFDRFDVKVKDRVIEIVPLATYDSERVVAQMLVPFNEVCTVDNLKPGDYDIKVHSRGDAVVARASVSVSE